MWYIISLQLNFEIISLKKISEEEIMKKFFLVVILFLVVCIIGYKITTVTSPIVGSYSGEFCNNGCYREHQSFKASEVGLLSDACVYTGTASEPINFTAVEGYSWEYYSATIIDQAKYCLVKK